MRASQLFVFTDKETPAEAEVVSHRLMLRARFVRQVASGIYSWLPMGWRVVRKIAAIVREEMDAAGGAEIFMPAVQPADLWRESGRWRAYGPELLRFADRHGREFCLGPTHEEVVTDVARACVTSYRRLPVNLYQIQTKFRDEIRPRFGIMRAREFVMKDAYSFDADEEGMARSYEAMRAAYCRIFDRVGLKYRMVEADSGAIGGSLSHEFMVLADSGEELVLHCEESGYAANVEHCPLPDDAQARAAPGREMARVATPGVKTIADLQAFLAANGFGEVSPCQNVKTMVVTGEAGSAAVLLRGDDALNLVKAGRMAAIGANARLATPAEARELVGAGFGSLGPVGMALPVFADFGLRAAADFVCGANADGFHFVGVNFGRDCPEPVFADLRSARPGDPSPCGGTLAGARGIEVGHIFQLGDKYSRAMRAVIDAGDGESRPILMGCYGIGVTRIVAAAIEQNHDARGMIFPESIAPFAVAVCPIGAGKSARVKAAAEAVYADCLAAGVEAVLDDRDLRPGAMFAECDLMGIPYRITVGERGLQNGEVEVKPRAAEEVWNVAQGEAAAFVAAKVRESLPR